MAHNASGVCDAAEGGVAVWYLNVFAIATKKQKGDNGNKSSDANAVLYEAACMKPKRGEYRMYEPNEKQLTYIKMTFSPAQ